MFLSTVLIKELQSDFGLTDITNDSVGIIGYSPVFDTRENALKLYNDSQIIGVSLKERTD